MLAMTKTPRKTLPTGIGKVLKRLHYPLDVILLCVRWYVAYSLSLRNLEEMMAERGIEVDHSSVHRWLIKLLPVFEKAFRDPLPDLGYLHAVCRAIVFCRQYRSFRIQESRRQVDVVPGRLRLLAIKKRSDEPI